MGGAIVVGVITIATPETRPGVYRVPSENMLPTLALGDRVEVDVAAYDGDRAPQIGDLILFAPPGGALTSTCGTTRRFWGPVAERWILGRAE